MLNEICSMYKPATICAIAIFAAMILGGCWLPPSLITKKSPPVAAATPSPALSPSPTATPDKNAETRAKEFAFNVREEEFLKLPAKVQLTTEPYIKGKAAFYNYDVELNEPETFWLLDNDLRGDFSGYDLKIKDVTAQMPNEVETVVIRKCRQVRKGSYVVRGSDLSVPAYIWRCELTLVDRTIPAIVYRKKFESELEETRSIGSSQDVVDAGIPYEEIYTFLGDLPRK